MTDENNKAYMVDVAGFMFTCKTEQEYEDTMLAIERAKASLGDSFTEPTKGNIEQESKAYEALKGSMIEEMRNIVKERQHAELQPEPEQEQGIELEAEPAL